VLATTEAGKVLPTVVDRCHRFDFQRPTVREIAGVLRRVADVEGIRAPDAALALVARHATGSFRDALGTLEQLTTYGAAAAGGEIAVEDVLAVLGVADAEALFGAVDAVAAHDARAALLAVARLVESGRDAGQLVRELEAHARELLAVQVLGEVPAELRLTPERDERLAAQAAQLGRQDVVRLLDLLAAALEALAAGAQPRIQLELALVKAAAPEVDPSTRALLARIDRLEARLGGGAPAPEPPPAPVPASEAPAGDPTPPPAPTQPDPPVAAAGSPDLDALRALWPAVVDAIRAEPEGAMLAAALEQARPIAVESGEVALAFPADQTFFKRKADTDEHRRAVAEALRALSGTALRPRYELRELDDAEPALAPAAPGLSDDELVARFVAEFDAEELIDEEEAGA